LLLSPRCSQSAIAASSDSPIPRLDVAQSITKQVTGSVARELVVAEAKQGGLTAREATSATGAKLRTLVQDHKGGFAVLAVLEDGQSAATFSGLIPAGASLKATGDGGFRIIGSDGIETSAINAPWARDASGRNLPTSYSVDGANVIQTVDTQGATYPIVADPYLTFGWLIYINYTKADVLRYYPGSVFLNQAAAAAACAVIGNVYGAAACASLTAGWFQSIGDSFRQAKAQGRCVKIGLTYVGFVPVQWNPVNC